MALEFENPESTDIGGSFLKEPGTYHLLVMNLNEQPVSKKDSSLIDGFKVHCAVMHGTAPNQEKKEVELMFFNPKSTDKNNGEMAKKKQRRFVDATNVKAHPIAGTNRYAVDLQEAVGQQFIATLALGDDGKFLQLNFADIWHVDDPDAKNFPKDERALGLIPAGNRRAAETFAKAETSSNGHKPTPAQKPITTPPAAVGAGAAAVNLDDL